MDDDVLTEPWLVCYYVTRHKRNPAGEAMRSFVYIQIGPETMTCAVLRIGRIREKAGTKSEARHSPCSSGHLSKEPSEPERQVAGLKCLLGRLHYR
jgi:hypothetical protein